METNTRERILDVALGLFVDQGYDATSLRQIAEIMGFSKAAIYYHFASKDDLLLGLHLRLHDVFGDTLVGLARPDPTLEAWRSVLDGLIDAMVGQRKLLVFHRENHAAIERGLRDKHHHDEANEDMQEALSRTLADRAVPAAQRIRLVAAMGSIYATMGFGTDALGDLTTEEVAAETRAVVASLLAPPACRTTVTNQKPAGNSGRRTVSGTRETSRRA